MVTSLELKLNPENLPLTEAFRIHSIKLLRQCYIVLKFYDLMSDLTKIPNSQNFTVGFI